MKKAYGTPRATGDLWLRTSAAALTAGCAAMATTLSPAFAQSDDEDEPQDTMIVTGSRLNQANLSSPSPVFQVDAGEINARGVTRIEDLVNTLPQAFAAQTSNTANGATGTSQVNLRGLGAIRTLVLIDGKRLPFGSAQSAPANLDIVPTQLVERVDVVTGGASAVYGSDAVAGVTNFILKRDFEGIEFDGQVGFYQDGNGQTGSDSAIVREALALSSNSIPGGQLDGRYVNASVLFGANTPDGRGNVTAHLTYQDQNEVRQGSRDHGACAIGTDGSAFSFEGVGCIGSSTFRRFDPPAALGVPSLFQLEDGTFVPRSGGPTQTFNFNPDNFYQRPNERFTIYTTAHYEITKNIEAYLDFTYLTNQTDAQIAFSGTFGRPFQVNCDNPLLDAPVSLGGNLAEAFCTPDQIADGTDVPFVSFRRNVEGDPRNSFIDLNTLRLVGGFRGEFADAFSYDTYGQFARSTLTDISENDLNFERLQDAIFLVDDGTGSPVCRSGNAGCVPYNVFQRGPSGETLITDEAVDFIQGIGITTGITEQIVLGGTLSGDFTKYGIKLPWADAGVQALVGIEYREDAIARRSDDVSQIPGGLGLTGVGGGTLNIDGEVRVAEVFFETQIPLVQDKPFFEELAINGAYRFSDYTTEGNGTTNSFSTDTFSAGLTWSPVSDVLIRAQFQRAVRAPNVFELFLGQNTGLFTPTGLANGFVDPCAGDFVFTDFNSDGTDDFPAPNATLEQCMNTGVTAANFGLISDNPARQLNAVTGGNPFLTPESADTYTVGVVIQPRWVDGLNIAIDYFDITLDDAIGTIPPAVALDTCIATGDAAFCDLIVRDRFGSLYIDNSNFEGVQATNVNIAQEARRGIDFAINYAYDLDQWGSLNFNYVSSYLLEDTQVPLPGGTPIECEGLYAGGCNATFTPVFEYTHRLLTTWQTPYDVDITTTWRYLSSVDSQGGPAGNVLSTTLEAANYLDLSAQWFVNENLTMRAGINNILGRDPNLTTLAGNGPAGNGNTYPGSYTPLGRNIFVGVNLAF